MILTLPGTLFSQNLTGIWKGYFITKGFNQYKVEFQLKQTKRGLTGVSYSYLTTVYYGKATMQGQVMSSSNVTIREIRTLEARSSDGGGTCIMNFKLAYSRSGREEYLEGTFTSQYETTTEDGKKGEDCGGGKVYLRRVKSSDFYPEPFLQNSTTKKVIVNEAPQKQSSQKPKEENSLAEPKPVTSQRLSATENPLPMAVAQLGKESGKTSLQKPPPTIPSVSNNRFNDLLKVLTVTSPTVKVSLYDNGEIDGDTVSVYLNNKIVITDKRLSTSPLQLSLQLNEENSIQEITIVAENLGKIPPNTALMIVEAGDQQFRVQITSTEQKNAVVRFRYEPQKP